MRRIWVILLICGLLFGDEVKMQKRGDSPRVGDSSEYGKRVETPKRQRTQKVQKTQKAVESRNKARKNATNQSAKKAQKVGDSTSDSKESQKQDSTKTPKKSPKAQSKSAEIKKLTDKKKQRLGYRNITIQNIKKQKKISVDFFVGVQVGADIVSMQKITEDDNRAKNTHDSISGSGSIGLKGGIVSEDEWVGGRFYAELSYTKFPKFDVVSVGVDLDLLIKYYETPSWKIGGFIGLGGGMNLALIADSALDNAGKKSLISVGWVNVGLLRFIYYHSTGNHGAELNAKIAYVTPTIYSLKDKNTGITTSYKGSSSSVMISYIYQF